MSDAYRSPAPHDRGAALAEEFALLSAEDQALVLALVARLRGLVNEAAYPPDVPFMDFEE